MRNVDMMVDIDMATGIRVTQIDVPPDVGVTQIDVPPDVGMAQIDVPPDVGMTQIDVPPDVGMYPVDMPYIHVNGITMYVDMRGASRAYVNVGPVGLVRRQLPYIDVRHIELADVDVR